VNIHQEEEPHGDLGQDYKIRVCKYQNIGTNIFFQCFVMSELQTDSYWFFLRREPSSLESMMYCWCSVVSSC